MAYIYYHVEYMKTFKFSMKKYSVVTQNLLLLMYSYNFI